MKRTWAVRAAVPLAVAILLSGCGGDAKPGATPSSTSAASPTTSSPTTSSPTTSSPATSSPTTDPNIPAAARAHTPAGAGAFVKYFHDQLNVAWGQPRTGLLALLSLPGCKTCAVLESNATDMATSQRHTVGDAVRIDSVDPGGSEPNGDQRVVITGAQLKTSVVDSNGQKVRDIAASPIRSVATLRWTASGWLLSEIKVLK